MRIYLIEDSEVYRSVLSRLLVTCTPFSISKEFPNAKSLCDAICNGDDQPFDLPDVFLLDLYLPDMDGWEILELLHKKEITTPVIIISQSSSQNDILRSKDYPNVVGYFIKSDFPANLFSMISELDPQG